MILSPVDLQNIFVTNSGLLTDEEFAIASSTATETQTPLEEFIINQYFISEEQYIALLSDFFDVPGTRLPLADVQSEALGLMSKEYAEAHAVIPFSVDGEVVKVAVLNPRDTESIAQVKTISGKEISVYVTSKESFERALLLYNGNVLELLRNKITADADHSDLAKLLDNVVEAAVLAHASDIHIEPYGTDTVIRLRVDGALQLIARVKKELHQTLIARIKVVASLKVDEHRLPQDGRFSTKVGEKKVDVRVSLVPSVWGEKVVMRVLVKGVVQYNLTSLGFDDTDLDKITRNLKGSYGMILLCGPTGSGKTTTLYSCLKAIASERIDVINISTVEDPIEYTVPRVTQIQIQPDIELTFSNGLRSLLRQDPDVLMVGEIRDSETANIATRAALVGRLLLSSVHANDAVSVIPRMLSMDTDPYLLADTLRLVISQRLVRRLCIHCRQSAVPGEEERDRLYTHYQLHDALNVLHAHGLITEDTRSGESLRLYKSVGCERCNNTGYLGRVAVYEVLEVNDVLRAQIANRAELHEIRDVLQKAGFKTMFADGVYKALNGVTDIDEVIKAVT